MGILKLFKEKKDAATLNEQSATMFDKIAQITGDSSLSDTMGEIIKKSGNNLAGAQSVNSLAQKAFDQQIQNQTMAQKIKLMQAQVNGTSPQIDPTTGQPTPQALPNMVIPKIDVGGVTVENPNLENQILAQQKATENSASLKLDAQKKFQDALPVISSAVQSLNDVQSLAQQLPDYKATVGGQVGARAQAAASAFAKDPAVTKYLATTAKVGPSLTRLNIGTSNRINVNELEATAKGLGDITTPLNTKLDLLDNFRNSVVGPLKVEAQSAGFTPDTLKQQYPDVYQAIYTRPVIDTKSGQMGFVPNEKFQAAIKSGRFKRA